MICKTKGVHRAWRIHKNYWKACVHCEISKYAMKHILGRGEIPCDILFLGEGPGRSEDVLGEPFVGRAGKLLDKAIQRAQGVATFSYALSNLVACRPCDGQGRGNRPPTPNECENCEPRLKEFVDIANPNLIVLLGNHAQQELVTKRYVHNCNLLMMYHPAYLLRQGGVKSPLWKSYVETLLMSVREHCGKD